MRFKLFFLSVFIAIQGFGQSDFIHVDQFGYYTNMLKIAVLSDPQIGFNAGDSYSPPTTLNVIDQSSGITVYTGAVSQWKSGITDAHSGDRGWRFDFSALTTPGTYYINDAVNDEQSAVFEVNSIPYNELLKVAGRMFFYNRCNDEKLTVYTGGSQWSDEMNFMNPLQDANCRYIYAPNDVALEKDLSGGWFDAGDYNKYVTFAEIPVHNLIFAYTSNPTLFSDNWNIPESGNGVADIVDEIKWELDWLLKMTNADGSVHIKMGNQNYSENSMSPPSINTDPRFYGATCTSASIAASGMFAHAALLFDTIPGYQTYSDQLKSAAEDCFNYALPYFNAGTLELDCDDGSIVAGDADRDIERQTNGMITASAYLYELTNSSVFHQFFITHGLASQPVFGNYWGPYYGFMHQALLHYTDLPSADNSMKTEILSSFGNAIANNWIDYFGENDTTLYRDYMPGWAYHWGSNQTKASFGMLNILARRYGPNPNSYPALEERAEAILQSFHGVNPLNLVYLSNMYDFGAEKSINEIYHGWFSDGTDFDNAQSSLYGPPPGYVVGGPNQYFSNANFTPPYGQPQQKAYLDFNNGYPDNSWEVSEPAIYYQASYLLLLSEIIALHQDDYLSTKVLTESSALSVSPNPNNGTLHISLGNEFKDVIVDIIDASGKCVFHETKSSTKNFSLSHSLKAGIYFLKVTSNDLPFDVKRIVVE